MANTVVLKRSSVQGKSPTTSDLALGELALNTTDGNLFFKRDVSGTQSILAVATLTGTQTLTNKTLTSPTLNTATADALTLTGTLTAGGGAGTNGQVLTSTGSGVVWSTAGNALGNLSDVTITSPEADQVLKYNGVNWINAAPDEQAAASVVFAPNAESDLGFVTTIIVDFSEDNGLVTDTSLFVYNLGSLVVDGIVSLSNLDQSVKADYIAYSIIFGF
jgi:hypothetical protein